MQIGLIVTLRYPGRGLGGRQSEVNSQSLEFSLQKCHATGRPPPQFAVATKFILAASQKSELVLQLFPLKSMICTTFVNLYIRK